VLRYGEDSWPYGEKKLILLTTRSTTNLKLRKQVTVAGSIDETLGIINEERYTDVWVDGGATISASIRRKLISEMVLSTIASAIGSGIRLFQDLQSDLRLDIVASEVLDELLITKYRVCYDR
jgi:dihydrofolate reductase